MPSKNEFGETLRKLREKRGLSITEAAAASSEISIEAGGKVSHPYLSLIESGRAKNVSIPKLITLSVLYGVSAARLIEKAPEPARARLRQLLMEHRKNRERMGLPAEPPPVRYLPQHKNEQDAWLWDVFLENIVSGSTLPAKYRTLTTSILLDLLVFSALPAYLETTHPTKLASIVSKATAEIDYARLPPLQSWHAIVEDVALEIRYGADRFCIHDLASQIAKWSIDLEEEGLFDPSLVRASCEIAGSSGARYSYQGVPPHVVRAVRWRQAAGLIAKHLPPDLAKAAPPPPSPLGAVFECAMQAAFPGASMPVPNQDANVDRAASALIGIVAALRSAGLPGDEDGESSRIATEAVGFVVRSAKAE